MPSWEETYVILATEFDATLSDTPNEIIHLRTALLSLINLTSSSSIRDDNNSSSGSLVGTEAAVDLLNQMNQLYLQAKQHYNYVSWRARMVTSINNFTIRNFGDLTVFVNDVVSWGDQCVPFYWTELSENGTGNTSEWIVCS